MYTDKTPYYTHVSGGEQCLRQLVRSDCKMDGGSFRAVLEGSSMSNVERFKGYFVFLLEKRKITVYFYAPFYVSHSFRVPVKGHTGDPLTGVVLWRLPGNGCLLGPFSWAQSGPWTLTRPLGDCCWLPIVCVCMCVWYTCPKGSLEASWGPMTPHCLRPACCQSVFVMTVGLLLYRLNHHSQLFIYRPNPWQPSWHQTHTRYSHTPTSLTILCCFIVSLVPFAHTKRNTSTSCESVSLWGIRKEDETKGRMRKMCNKAKEGERRPKGIWPLTSVLWLGSFGGQRTQQPRLISNYTIDTAESWTEREKAKHKKIQFTLNLDNLCDRKWSPFKAVKHSFTCLVAQLLQQWELNKNGMGEELLKQNKLQQHIK